MRSPAWCWRRAWHSREQPIELLAAMTSRSSRHAIAVTKDNDTAHLNLGFALEKAGRKAEAMAEYRARAEDRSRPRRTAQQHCQSARRHRSVRTKRWPNTGRRCGSIPITSRRTTIFGTLLVELGRFDEAMKQYAEAARLDPNDWHAPFLIGQGAAQTRPRRGSHFLLSARRCTVDPNNLPAC